MIKTGNPSVAKANALLGLQFLSDFGDQISAALLALCLLDISQSTGAVGFVYFITTIGYVVFTLAGGLLGDRISRKNILFFSDFARGLAALLLILAVKEKSITLIYFTSFLLSILGSIHRPVKLTIWAESIPTKFLERYNSLSELSIQASTIIGPLIASFFIMRSWTTLGFTVDAITFFICSIVFLSLVQNRKKLAQPQEEKAGWLTGFKLISQRADMAKYVTYDAIQMIGFGAFNATFLILAQRDYAWSKTDYSYHLTIVALFTTVGALLGATQFVERINATAKLTACALLSAVFLWIALHMQAFPITSIFVGVCDGLTVLTMAVTRTKVQLIAKHIYPQFISCIIAARYIIIKAATLLGTGACLLIDDFISLQSTLMILIIPIAASAIPFLFGRNDFSMGAILPTVVGTTNEE